MTRRVLVTGASRGIGRAIAVRLAADDFDVTVHYRSGADAARETLAAVEAAGGTGSLLAFDVTDRAATAAALEAELEQRGAFWGVVSNAGVTDDGPLAGLSGEAWDRVVDTSLGGFYNVLRPLLMPMVRLRSGGRVVAISSVTGRTGNRGQANYAAAKAGLIAATRSLALELAKRGITANSVAPGFVETDMVAGLPREELEKLIPMGRFGAPEEVAGCVAFLFGSEASYITGQTLGVDGGLA